MKRCLDIFFSSVALLLLSPILIPIALLLLMTGEGEVFFIQERIGYGGRPFGLFKFATMMKDSPNLGTGTITVKDDPRVLPLGKILRKTKINELPQLLNILLGHMSVIGPRPLTRETFYLYDSNTQLIITKVRPGLSGIQQIVTRDEEGLVDLSMVSEDFYGTVLAPYKGELEKWFVKHDNLYIYFAIIIMTLWIIATPNNNAVWRVFRELPEPPDELKEKLNYRLNQK